MKLPDLKQLDNLDLDLIEPKDKILKNLLTNTLEIKKLEEDNKKLQNILVKNQELVKGGLQKKVDALMHLLEKKDKHFQILKHTILKDYNILIQKLEERFIVEKTRNKKLILNLNSVLNELKKEKIINKKLHETTIKTKFLLKRDFDKKITKIKDEFRFNKNSHKNIIKQYEESKLHHKNSLEVERKKTEFLVGKNEKLLNLAENVEKENKELRQLNKKLLLKINYLDKNSLANNKKLEHKITSMKLEMEEKLKDVVKVHLEKEIEYKAKIDSLNDDLRRYYHELKMFKIKYKDREEELKEKIKNLNLF